MSGRAYAECLTHELVDEEISEHFCPEVLGRFREIIDQVPLLVDALDTGLVAISSEDLSRSDEAMARFAVKHRGCSIGVRESDGWSLHLL